MRLLKATILKDAAPESIMSTKYGSNPSWSPVSGKTVALGVWAIGYDDIAVIFVINTHHIA